MTIDAETQRFRLDIVAILLAYYAKTCSVQPSLKELLIDATHIEEWINREVNDSPLKPLVF